ncbi:uncharacterized protein LOC128735691 [Sabethes cyaneus]|uniref:uncharacterized protein LOC128735691 n=1 Tax=Sabethes cyaneus TaxID=53552 RepID=UPI00237E80E6|nr:uncharacterized protein LOC128735691 [Sabethes cyaneus]
MSDEEVKLLAHKRGQVKAKVTRLRNSLKAADEEPTNFSMPQLRVFSKNLENHYREFNEVHDALISACVPNQRDSQDKKYEEFEVLYNETCVVIETLKDNLSATPAAIPDQAGGTQVIVQQQALRAPLPTFNGEYENWPRFKSMFQDLMRRSADCDAIKLYHLEKSLVGAAAGVIGSQTIQDNNYEQAWNILEERYENERLIIDSHIRGLLNLKRMTKKSSKELRELLDECCRHVDSLKFLKQELTGVSELVIINVLTNALDKETREHWESSLTHGQLPSYSNTIECLRSRCLVLERCETANPSSVPVKPTVSGKMNLFPKQFHKTAHAVTSAVVVTCELCGGQHPNFKCGIFRDMTIAQRISKVKEAKLCFNCLRKGHRSNTCQSEKVCVKCAQKHHTLLHIEKSDDVIECSESSSILNNTSPRDRASSVPVPASNALVNQVSSSHQNRSISKEVFLLTAVVQLVDESGCTHRCRALLDCASQVCLISQDMADKLGKRSWSTNTEVNGVTGKSCANKGIMVTVASSYSEYSLDVPCLVLPKVSGMIPTRKIDIKKWHLPANIELADPEFFLPNRIDLLIGNQFFFRLLKSGQLRISDNLPILQETVFGWVVAGAADVPEHRFVFSHVITEEDLAASIHKFWAIEEVINLSFPSVEEQQVEEHFVKTHRRNETGRFVVRLPFRDSVSHLDTNRALALKRFYLLEKRLSRHPELKQQYVSFINEYETLGHCHEIFEENDAAGSQCYFMPHHAVLKPTSTSTKLRVVFDASARSSKLCLNDVLQVGPTVQNDLFSILLQFRRHRFAFSADIAKMYRQILVDDRDSRFQRIFWRSQPSEPLRILELTTVTYGTASAPFLATRSLVQLAEDEQSEFPDAAKVVREDFYIDDVLSGANTESEAISLRKDLQKILAKGGFDIRKWCSNSEVMLAEIPEGEREKLLQIDDANNTVKTLGLQWDTRNDQFRYFFQSVEYNVPVPITKRYVLSQISKLFDPLGFVSPVIVKAKVLMQTLWSRKLEWDETLPDDLLLQWRILYNSLRFLNQIKLPRCIIPYHADTLEVHGFADASLSAYGACLYLRATGVEAKCNLLPFECSRVFQVEKTKHDICQTIEHRSFPKHALT